MFAESWINLFGSLYIGAIIVFLLLAIWLPRSLQVKGLAVVFVLLFFIGVPYVLSLPSAEQEKMRSDFLARASKSKTRFEKLCRERAELKIVRTAMGANGIRLMNSLAERAKDRSDYYWDRDWPDAAMAGEFGGDSFIESFLVQGKVDAHGTFLGNYAAEYAGQIPGYKFVDVRQDDGKYKRYRLDFSRHQIVVDDGLLSSDDPRLARYAVEFNNEIDMDAREDWIAGSEISVRDMSNGEIMAVYRKYVRDPGLGDPKIPSTPWFIANRNKNTCPQIESAVMYSRVGFFVSKVVKVAEGE